MLIQNKERLGEQGSQATALPACNRNVVLFVVIACFIAVHPPAGGLQVL